MSLVRYAALLSVIAFGAVTAAVALGGLTRVDQWSLDHLMPWLSPVNYSPTVASVMLPFSGRTHGAEVPLELWVYPASVPVSALAVAGCSVLLWRRGSHAAAAGWLVVWVAANVVEVMGKLLIHRPALYMVWHGEVVQAGFRHSFPSGHTLRALLVAALLASLWPRLRASMVVWATATVALLVVTNAHTPSDVLGGALLSTALAAFATSRPRVRCSRHSQTAARQVAADTSSG